MTPRDPAEILDVALAGDTPDETVAALSEIADGLRTSFGAPAPPAPGTRALFVQGVVARKAERRGPRILVPSLALGVLALVVAVLSRTALPGSALYQVRKVLASVDLAPTAQHEVDARITRARDELALAESLLPGKASPALASANVALEQLGQARSFLNDVGGGDRSKDLAAIAALEERADSVIAQAHAAMQSHSPSDSSPTTSTSGPGAGPARSDDSGRGDASRSEGSGPSGGRGNESAHGSGSRSGSDGNDGNDGSSQGGSKGDASGSQDQGSGSSGSRDDGHGSGSSNSGDRSGGSGSDDQQSGSGDSSSGGSDGSDHSSGSDPDGIGGGSSGGSDSGTGGLGGTSKSGGSSGGSRSDDGAPGQD